MRSHLPSLYRSGCDWPAFATRSFCRPFCHVAKARGHEAAFDPALADKMIHLAQHFRGLQFLRRQAAHDADRHGAVKRRGSALSADVAERNAQLLRPVAQKFVKVAADFARGEIARGNI